MSNFKLDGRTIAIIAFLVIAAIIFLPQLLNRGGDTATDNRPLDDDNVNEPVNPRDTTANEEDNIELGRVVMAEGVDRDGCPTNTTSTFDPTDEVYVVAENATVEEGTAVYVRWYLDGEPYEDADEIVADQDYEGTCISFILEPDQADVLQSGEYEAEFIINGNPADTVSFEVR